MTESLDVLGESGRAQLALAAIGDVQRNAENLENIVAAADLADDDPSPIAMADGKSRTVKEARAFLAAAERRLLDRHKALAPVIQQRLAQQGGGIV